MGGRRQELIPAAHCPELRISAGSGTRDRVSIHTAPSVLVGYDCIQFSGSVSQDRVLARPRPACSTPHAAFARNLNLSFCEVRQFGGFVPVKMWTHLYFLSLCVDRQRSAGMFVQRQIWKNGAGQLPRTGEGCHRDAGHGPDARESRAAYRITPSKSSGMAVNGTSHHASGRAGPGGDFLGSPAVLVSYRERASDSTAHAYRVGARANGGHERYVVRASAALAYAWEAIVQALTHAKSPSTNTSAACRCSMSEGLSSRPASDFLSSCTSRRIPERPGPIDHVAAQAFP